MTALPRGFISQLPGRNSRSELTVWPMAPCVDEHARMMRLHAAGRIDVLDAWRASLDLLEHVVSGTENTARIASESLIIAVRAMEGLPPRPRGR